MTSRGAMVNARASLPKELPVEAARCDASVAAVKPALATSRAVPMRTGPLAVALEADFDFGSAEYRELLRRADVTAFQSREWLARLVGDLVPGAGRPSPLVVRDAASRRPLLVLPLMRRVRHGLEVVEMIDCGVTDYNLPVVDGEAEMRLTADPSLPRRIERCLAPYDLLAISKVSRHRDLISHLFPRARMAPMLVSAHGAALSGTWPEWRARNISPRVRRYLDKKRRSLARQGRVTFWLETKPAAIAAAFEALRHYRRLRFAAIGADDVMADDIVYRFYLRTAVEGAETGSARTYVLSLDGRPAGIVFGLVHAGTFLHLLLAFDVEQHARRSLGLLASEDAIRAVLESGLDTYDFTIGDHPFKAQLGAIASPLSEWHQAGRWRGRVALGLHVAQRESKRWLKPLVRPVVHPPYSPLSGR